MEAVITIAFWISIGLLYVGVHFQYQEPLIGICALIIGIVQLIALIPKDSGTTSSPPKG